MVGSKIDFDFSLYDRDLTLFYQRISSFFFFGLIVKAAMHCLKAAMLFHN